MPKTRVLHLIEYFYLGGIERLLEQLAFNSPSDTELQFYTYETHELMGIGKELRDRGFKVWTWKKSSGTDLKLVADLNKVLKEQQIDIVHTHDFGPTEYAFFLKLLNPGLKLVHTQHTVHHFIIHQRYRWFFTVASHAYSSIIAVSGFVDRALKEGCPLMNKAALGTVANGINTNKFVAQKVIGLGQGLQLVSIARVSYEKNLEYLLNELAELNRLGIPFHWHHAGTGKHPEALEGLQKLAQDLKIQQHTTFYGYVSDPTPIFEKADVYISSSLKEGHPVSVLEAMACEKFCLCSDIPPHREIGGGLFTYFDVNRPLTLATELKRLFERLSSDPNCLNKVRSQVREVVVNNFSITKMVNEYGKVYEQVLKK